MRRRNTLHLFNLLNALLPGSALQRLRRWGLRRAGVRVRDGADIGCGAKFFCQNIEIGAESWIGVDCLFYANFDSQISIGSQCDIGPQVSMITGTHEIGEKARRAGTGKSAPIRIGDGCWVGARVTILGGATIGPGCIVAAGAVVRGGMYPPNSLIAGIPAKVMRVLEG